MMAQATPVQPLQALTYRCTGRHLVILAHATEDHNVVLQRLGEGGGGEKQGEAQRATAPCDASPSLFCVRCQPAQW